MKSKPKGLKRSQIVNTTVLNVGQDGFTHFKVLSTDAVGFYYIPIDPTTKEVARYSTGYKAWRQYCCWDSKAFDQIKKELNITWDDYEK